MPTFTRTFTHPGSLERFINYRVNFGLEDSVNFSLIEDKVVGDERKVKRSVTVPIAIPETLKKATGFHNITVIEDITINSNSFTCKMVSPKNISYLFTFSEEYVVTEDKGVLTGVFTCNGEGMKLDFKDVVWNSYLRQRISRLKEEISLCEEEKNWEDDDILQ
jgi:hypothetical protein